MTSKRVATRILLVSIAALALSRPTASQSLGTAASFAVLSSGDVTFKNRDNVNAPSGEGICPGPVGCLGDVSGVTVLMGRGNGAAPDTVSGDVIASASSALGLNCSGNPPGTTAICLGNDSEVGGLCATGGGAVDSPTECAAGADTSGSNSDVTSLLPQAYLAMASFSTSLSLLAVTKSLPEIALGTGGTTTICAPSSGLNVITVQMPPSRSKQVRWIPL